MFKNIYLKNIFIKNKMSYAKYKDLGDKKENPEPQPSPSSLVSNNNSSIRNSMIRKSERAFDDPNNQMVNIESDGEYGYDIDIKNLEHKINILKNKRIVVVDYYSDTCRPCTNMQSRYLHIAKMYNQHNNIMVVKENINLGIFDKKNISSVPTIEFYKDGAIVHTIYGPNIDEIRNKIEELKDLL